MKKTKPKNKKDSSVVKKKKLTTTKKPAKKSGTAKKTVKSVELKKKKTDQEIDKKKYYEAVGRRKSAVARVRLFTSSPSQSAVEGNITVNGKSYKESFSTLEFQEIIESPLKRLKSLNRFRATVKVGGGGKRGQAEAIRHGIARTLVLFDNNFRKKLKKAGYLTRDPRKKERKKYGLKKARRRPQWSKR